MWQELGRLAVTLSVKSRFGISGALVRLIRALLLMEAALSIAARAVPVVVAPILPAEALDRRPRLEQGPAHREVIAGHEPLHLGLRQHRRQELRRDRAFQEPIPVLGECRVIPDRIVDPEPKEPAEQQVELHPLHQLALGPHPVEGLQQHRPQQLFRGDRGPAEFV
jgi:hypothetical protein